MLHNNLHYFVQDDQIRPFLEEERRDLDPGSGAPALSPTEFTIFEFETKKTQALIVKSYAPYLMRRTAIGDAVLESFELVTNDEAGGFFSFHPLVEDSSPLIIESNVNAMAVGGTALSDGDRLRQPGLTHVSNNPQMDIFLFKDNSFTLLVPGNSKFSIQMRVLRTATVGGIPNPFAIGSNAIGNQKRIDVAGAVVYGVTMPESYYNRLKNRWFELIG